VLIVELTLNQNRKINKMTKIEFLAICIANSIDPEIALDNENLTNALRQRDDKRVEKIIKEEF
jgi:hypothetical protein